MTALQAPNPVRLPVGRIAPIVVGVAALASVALIGGVALVRPAELGTAVVAGGSVVITVGGMYALLGVIRTRYLVSLTTIFMGLSMARLMVSVMIGVAYMLTAQYAGGGRPDKMVFGVVFLGVSLAVLGVETVLIRQIIHRLGESIAREARGEVAGGGKPDLQPAQREVGLGADPHGGHA